MNEMTRGQICTFIGHRDSPESLYPAIKAAIAQLVHEGVADVFYVGDSGAFDRMAAQALGELKAGGTALEYCVVLTRPPAPGRGSAAPTLVPAGIERVPPRRAIVWRNLWMLRRARALVSHASHPGNAADVTAQARRMGLRVTEV